MGMAYNTQYSSTNSFNNFVRNLFSHSSVINYILYWSLSLPCEPYYTGINIFTEFCRLYAEHLYLKATSSHLSALGSHKFPSVMVSIRHTREEGSAHSIYIMLYVWLATWLLWSTKCTTECLEQISFRHFMSNSPVTSHFRIVPE